MNSRSQWTTLKAAVQHVSKNNQPLSYQLESCSSLGLLLANQRESGPNPITIGNASNLSSLSSAPEALVNEKTACVNWVPGWWKTPSELMEVCCSPTSPRSGNCRLNKLALGDLCGGSGRGCGSLKDGFALCATSFMQRPTSERWPSYLLWSHLVPESLFRNTCPSPAWF